MRVYALIFFTITLGGCGTLQSLSGTGIVKVLPHYLDAAGNHTNGPTLLRRDVYQDKLRKNPDLVHALRYDVNWYGSGEVKLRLELRSTKAGVESMIIEKVTRKHWTPILIDAATYKTFGRPESWRVSLWRGEEQVAAQKSFLW